MVEMPVKEEWVGKNLVELSLRQRHKVNVIAFRRNGELDTDIDPKMLLQKGDNILITIDKKYINELNN